MTTDQRSAIEPEKTPLFIGVGVEFTGAIRHSGPQDEKAVILGQFGRNADQGHRNEFTFHAHSAIGDQETQHLLEIRPHFFNRLADVRQTTWPASHESCIFAKRWSELLPQSRPLRLPSASHAHRDSKCQLYLT